MLQQTTTVLTTMEVKNITRETASPEASIKRTSFSFLQASWQLQPYMDAKPVFSYCMPQNIYWDPLGSFMLLMRSAYSLSRTPSSPLWKQRGPHLAEEGGGGVGQMVPIPAEAALDSEGPPAGSSPKLSRAIGPFRSSPPRGRGASASRAHAGRLRWLPREKGERRRRLPGWLLLRASLGSCFLLPVCSSNTTAAGGAGIAKRGGGNPQLPGSCNQGDCNSCCCTPAGRDWGGRAGNQMGGSLSSFASRGLAMRSCLCAWEGGAPAAPPGERGPLLDFVLPGGGGGAVRGEAGQMFGRGQMLKTSGPGGWKEPGGGGEGNLISPILRPILMKPLEQRERWVGSSTAKTFDGQGGQAGGRLVCPGLLFLAQIGTG